MAHDSKQKPAPISAEPISEMELVQQFSASLTQLEKYWHNKVDSLKKQGDAHNRELLDEAINQANKYSALQDMIAEFENDWASQTILAAAPKAPKEPKASKKAKNIPAKAGEPAAIMPLLEASPHLAIEMVDDLEDDALIDDLEDELASDLDFESVSELEFADDSAAFFPEDDMFDDDADDHAN